MSCQLTQRVKPLSQCGTYRLFLFQGLTTAVNVFIESISRERTLTDSYTPVLTTKDGTNISYIDILYSDFGEFLNSGSDFEVMVERAGEPILIYLGLDSEGEQILADSVTAEFKAVYNTDNEKVQVSTEEIEI